MDGVRRIITDDVWEQLEAALVRVKSPRGAKPDLPDREFFEAVLHLTRTGEPWRDVPECFGKWDAVYQRFRRWVKTGLWQRLWEELQGDEYPKARMVFVDSTIVRAHMHAAGAPAKKGGKQTKHWAVLAVGSAPKSISWQRMRTPRSPSS
jgi:transposase